MKQEAKISVIVPVYGVERYISDCIRSLCDQTWKNLEILLIDDGSKDGSGKICDEWAKKDSRIRVFHVENGGQSRARNIGMKEASGDYIGFVDGDDAAAPEMYEHLHGLMQKYDAQIAECNFEGRKSPEPDQMQEQAVVTMSGKAAIRKQLDYYTDSRFPSTSLWSKLFEASLIKDLRLPEGCIHEEYEFLCRAFCNCQTYVYENTRLYHRTLRTDSTTAEAFSERALDKMKVFALRSSYLERSGDLELWRLARQQEFILMLYLYGECTKYGMKAQAKTIQKQLQACRKEIKASGLSKSEMTKFRLFWSCPFLYGWLKKRKRG